MNRITFAVAWIALQFCYLSGWALNESYRLLPGQGQSILVHTVPVDPRDLLRGQYMQLRYPFSTADRKLELDRGQTVWVALRPVEKDGKTYYEPFDYAKKKTVWGEPDAVVIRGTAEGYNRIRFGIERYYVPEGTETPNQKDITVRLRIGTDYRPRIEKVYVKNKPWPY